MDTFKGSSSYYLNKVYLIRQYFRIFTVFDFETIITSMEHHFQHNNGEQNPLFNVFNPIVVAVWIIDVLKKIKEKYKQLTVKCDELSDSLEEGTIKFLD